MIAVVSICAVLVVIRGASTLWLMEEAWSWWQGPRPGTPVGRADQPAPEQPRLIPRADPALAKMPSRGNPGQFFGPDAYPPDAIRAEQQGRTVARLLIDRTGTPIGCTIATSSGSRSLDAATCSIALGKVRYQPARDEHGAAIDSHVLLPVRWVLPKG